MEQPAKEMKRIQHIIGVVNQAKPVKPNKKK